ncbi:hypothetical protein [Streptomyces lunalinharesii]|uniref:hypothetical protein n=1 Tax=Streptomyces lunalinharesii TaxID=333384 RepID=UPI0031CF5AEE
MPLTPGERAAQREADARAAVFRGVHTEGVSVAFVAGIDEAEAVRRLGRDPHDGTAGPPDASAVPHDPAAAHRRVGVTGVAGGCVLLQPGSYLLGTDAALAALSAGATAYGLYFNPGGGTFGTLSRDGRTEPTEEIGLPPYGDEPEGHWRYRFWSRSRPQERYGAGALGYAAAAAGLRVTGPRPVSGPPHRWVEIPAGSPLLA